MSAWTQFSLGDDFTTWIVQEGPLINLLILVCALQEVHEEYCETTIIATRMTQFGQSRYGDRLPFVNIDPSAVFYVGPPWGFFFVPR